MKVVYEVQYHNYEFSSGSDEEWTAQDIFDAYNRESTQDAYAVEYFDTAEEAEKAVAKYGDKGGLRAWVQGTCYGHVVVGDLAEINGVEVEDEDIDELKGGNADVINGFTSYCVWHAQGTDGIKTWAGAKAGD